MGPDTIVLGTVEMEELPLHVEIRHSTQSLRPSAIEEDEHDARSLLYLFEDNDFERVAAYLAMEEARQNAELRVQAAAEAAIEAQVQRQRTHALAERLRQLMEQDEELIDMLGRRLLATNGYQVHDLWDPYHSPRHHHHHHHRHGPRDLYRHLQAESSRAEQFRQPADPADEFADLLHHARANHFIHAAPVILRGHNFSQARATQHDTTRAGLLSEPTASAPRDRKAPAHTNTSIAIHPLTGIPMLLFEEDVEPAVDAFSSKLMATASDEEPDEWDVDDDFDIDWLGRELLRRQGGADVWILGADNDRESLRSAATPSAATLSASSSANKAPSTETSSTKQSESTVLTLPIEVEEVDSDHEPGRTDRDSSTLSSPFSRIAAALSQASQHNSSSEEQASSSSPPRAGQTRKQRAATVMSESEEEELETVGKPVVEEKDEHPTHEASSLDDRPRKTVKVVDLR